MTPEEFVSRLLREHLDDDVADECYNALEGLDHDDLTSIRKAFGEHVREAKTLEAIMREYESWLFRYQLRDGA